MAAKSRTPNIPLLYPTPKLVMWIGLVIMIAYGISYLGRLGLVYSGFFRVEQIRITGNYYLDEKNIQEIADVDLHQSIFAVNLANITGQLLKNPYLRGVSVSRILPSTLLIDVQEREPILYLADNVVYMVDDVGMILEKLPRMTMGKLPIVTGLSYRQVKQDSTRLEYAVDLVSKVREVDVSLLTLISEINFQNKDTAPELVLIRGAARVKLGSDHLYQRIYLLSELLGKQPVMDELAHIRSIDLTFTERVIVQNKS